MRCKQAEESILEAFESTLDPQIKTALKNHVLNCPGCASFQIDLLRVHQGIEKLKTLEPSAQLIEKTTALCIDEIIKYKIPILSEGAYRLATRIPNFVWVASGMLFILTISWLISLTISLIKHQVINEFYIIFMILIVQNMIVLFFAPILLWLKQWSSLLH